jgi:hypothetical protein
MQKAAVVEVFFLVLFLLWKAVEKWITRPDINEELFFSPGHGGR